MSNPIALTDETESKAKWCIRCKSLRGKGWAKCQRCGFAVFNDVNPASKPKDKNHAPSDG